MDGRPPPIPTRSPGYEYYGAGYTPAPPPRPQQPYFAPLPQYPQQQYYPPPPQSYQQPYYHQPPTQAQPPRQQPAPQAQGWDMLFYADGTPTATFEALMAAFFERLDPQRSGHVTPEALSNFLDVQGFLTEHNIWKSNHNAAGPMFQPVDLADFELKAACEAWPFDHTVVVRSPGRPQLPYGGMPLLSLRGFTDMMAVEHAGFPDRAYRGLNSALLQYGVWPERGPLPRGALLPAMPPQVQYRIDQVRIRSKAAAEQKLAANAARNALKLQGQQNALDLIGNVRYVYY